jgi:hypothetical protein
MKIKKITVQLDDGTVDHEFDHDIEVGYDLGARVSDRDGGVTMSNKYKLKPCPFCGGEARILVVKKGFKSIIECTTHYCGFMRHSYNNGDTDENAALRLATAWNRRADNEPRKAD